MRPSSIVLLSGLVCAGALTASAASAGTSYPVCLQVYGPATYTECAYTSIAQCNASASGRGAQCFVNPFFAAAEPHGRRQGRGTY